MTTLADALATLTFKNRNPTWAEYEKASPCDQRAIAARWKEISEAGWQPDWGPSEMIPYHQAHKNYVRTIKPAGIVWDDGRAVYSREKDRASDGAPSWVGNDEIEWEGI